MRIALRSGSIPVNEDLGNASAIRKVHPPVPHPTSSTRAPALRRADSFGMQGRRNLRKLVWSQRVASSAASLR